MVVKCPVCGYRFDSSLNRACKSCPVGFDCDRICCPNCLYAWIESTSLVSRILNLFKKEKVIGRS
ncbi:MAG: hypothetical protein JSW64_04270 [Candidatus Zixiibacteriota bacterium]|nr:MAG: hypothetical protein JSW64_04270 [candidate division Zixibacteria bacterium]